MDLKYLIYFMVILVTYVPAYFIAKHDGYINPRSIIPQVQGVFIIIGLIVAAIYGLVLISKFLLSVMF